MNFVKTLLAAAALAVSAGAGATVSGSLGGGTGSFLALSGPAACTAVTPCTLGPGVGMVVGGTTYAADQTFADIPAGGSIFGGNFLAAGPSSGNTSTLTFTAPVSYISFLWGSPDLYNVLTVTSTVGPAQVFTAAGLGFATTNGNQSFSQYVQFLATAGSILSLTFTNDPQINAFEAANFSIVRVVPEPETYALMLAGLGALGFISRRRKRV